MKNRYKDTSLKAPMKFFFLPNKKIGFGFVRIKFKMQNTIKTLTLNSNPIHNISHRSSNPALKFGPYSYLYGFMEIKIFALGKKKELKKPTRSPGCFKTASLCRCLTAQKVSPVRNSIFTSFMYQSLTFMMTRKKNYKNRVSKGVMENIT